jgi:hypothetical protein
MTYRDERYTESRARLDGLRAVLARAHGVSASLDQGGTVLTIGPIVVRYRFGTYQAFAWFRGGSPIGQDSDVTRAASAIAQFALGSTASRD